MGIGLKFIAPLVAAGGVAAAMTTAPMAAADTTHLALTCNQSGPGTPCQSPGNVQFNDAATCSVLPVRRRVRSARRWRRTLVASTPAGPHRRSQPCESD